MSDRIKTFIIFRRALERDLIKRGIIDADASYRSVDSSLVAKIGKFCEDALYSYSNEQVIYQIEEWLDILGHVFVEIEAPEGWSTWLIDLDESINVNNSYLAGNVVNILQEGVANFFDILILLD